MFFNLKRKDLYVLRSIFRLIGMNFNDAFIARTRDGSGNARKYIQGLLLNRDRGNCSRFARKVRKSSSQSLQHFITHSPWNERIVIDKLQKKVGKMIGDSIEGSLHIDETGFPKQGDHSVGVQRQYCGRLGKVENCQVGVVLGYAHKNQRILIGGQLYLPKEWAKSKELRNKRLQHFRTIQCSRGCALMPVRTIPVLIPSPYHVIGQIKQQGLGR